MSESRIEAIFKRVLINIVHQEREKATRKKKYREAYTISDEEVQKILELFKKTYTAPEEEVIEILRGMSDDFKLEG